MVGLGALALVGLVGPGGAGAAERTAPEPAATPECKSAGVTVSFARGSTELDTNAQGALAGVATWLQNGDQRTVRLVGFADKAGGATGNQRLSERRAQAAKDFLVARGIEPDRIMVFGHGEATDHAPTLTADTRIVSVTACDVPQATASEAPAPEADAAASDATAVPASAPTAVVPPTAPRAPAPAFTPPPYEPNTVVPVPPPPHKPPSMIGVEATVGGGAIGFIDQGARDATQTGASWDARLMFGSRLPIAVEGAYVGSVQNIEALGLSTNSLLVGNGVEGTLRVNLLRKRVQPYLFGGMGWTHYQVTNTATNTSSVRGSDDIGTVPLGAGLSARLGTAFILDIRGTYRATFADELLHVQAANGTSSSNSMQSWNAAGRVGFEF
jgi:outer membrane protein OmpA-like peptidoglycan-associated protein